MAEWPRVIKPEDRIKYLIQARHDFKESITWNGMVAWSEQGEKLWVDSDEETHRAMYASDSSPEFLVGEYDRAFEAKKALIDHVVVLWAVRQAWEDVAT